MDKITRVVFVPFPGASHVNPMMMLAEKLVELGGVSATVIVAVRPKSKYYASDKVLVEEFLIDVPHSNIQGLGVRSFQPTVQFSTNSRIYLEQSMQAIQKRLETLASSESSPQIAVIDKSLFRRLQTGSLLFPVYLFSPFSASMDLFDHVIQSDPGVLQEEELQIPGLPLIRCQDFRWMASSAQAGSEEKFVLIMNTCHVLETEPIEALLSQRTLHKTYTVGPLIQPSGPVTGEKCMAWLNKQQPRSVVFICFGSWMRMCEEQVQELALGLERSKQGFLWVLPNAESLHSLPSVQEGSANGLIISGWAPQQLILENPALGAFVSTCGWNSVLECTTLAGVPIVAWPMFGDQILNCRNLVDVLKIGIEAIGDQSANGLVRRDEVESLVKHIMSKDDPEVLSMRERAVAVKEFICKNKDNQRNALSSLLEELKM